jgi:hypothetical protein
MAIIPPNPPPPLPPNYLFETLPTPVVGKVGDVVPLSTILTQEFGKNVDGYKNFYIGYFGQDALVQNYNPRLSFWTANPTTYNNWATGQGPAPGTMTQWVDGLALGPSFDALPAPEYTPMLDLGPNVYPWAITVSR